MRVVFMGTPDFAVPCLEMLVKEEYEIVAVVTQPDRPKGRGKKLTAPPVKEFALKSGLDVLQPERIKTPEVVGTLISLQPDVIVVVAFGQILSKAILDIPVYGCINVHASLLPYYRGAAPIHWAVIGGEAVTGITTMFMDVGLDTGDMILKKEIPIGKDETTGEIHDKLMNLGAGVLKDTLTLIAHNMAPRIPQNHAVSTYAPLLTRNLERVDWQQPAEKIHNLVRGMNPWPGAYFCYQNKTFKIWRTRIYDAAMTAGRPGRVSKITNEGIVIETGLGTVELLELQPESKKRMAAKDCVSGYCINVDAILE